MDILPYRASPAALLDTGRSALRRLLPASCLLCGGDTAEAPLCPACIADLPPLPAPACPQCAEPTTHGERCGACLKETPHFARTIALFRYEFPADRLVQALKYGHQLALAPWFGRQLSARLNDAAFDIIVPLPLHPARLSERGFNQAAEIAAHLQFSAKIPVDRSSVVRVRATSPQADLPMKSRAKNVRGAFECRSDFTGQRVLLVDDVMTTGATADECARVLKLHGAAEVIVAVVARALRG